MMLTPGKVPGLPGVSIIWDELAANKSSFGFRNPFATQDWHGFRNPNELLLAASSSQMMLTPGKPGTCGADG
jgi:hypothetical protein